MEAMEWYKNVLTQHYVDFNGRAHRPEFWYFALVNFCIALLIFIAGGLIGLSFLLIRLYSLAILLPHLGVSVRRLHDTGKSGWWVLIGLIPILGWIVLIYWYAQPGMPGSNEFGSDPKGNVAAVFS